MRRVVKLASGVFHGGQQRGVRVVLGRMRFFFNHFEGLHDNVLSLSQGRQLAGRRLVAVVSPRRFDNPPACFDLAPTARKEGMPADVQAHRRFLNHLVGKEHRHEARCDQRVQAPQLPGQRGR